MDLDEMSTTSGSSAVSTFHDAQRPAKRTKLQDSAKLEDELSQSVKAKLNALISGDYSDFTIDCGGKKKLGIHRILIAGHSQYFDALFSNKFKESAEMMVTLPEDEEVEPVVAVIAFIYTNIYPGCQKIISYLAGFCPDLAKPTAQEFTNHVKFFVAADRYMVPKMKNAALEVMRNNILASDCNTLVKSPDFEEAVAYMEANETACPELRTMVIWAVCRITKNEQEFYDLWDEFCKAQPSFGYAILKEKENKNRWRCDKPRYHHFNDTKTILVQDYNHSDTATFVSCSCDFRGLCSKYCESEDVRKHHDSYGQHFCEQCVRLGVVTINNRQGSQNYSVRFRFDGDKDGPRGKLVSITPGIDCRLVKNTITAELKKAVSSQ